MPSTPNSPRDYFRQQSLNQFLNRRGGTESYRRGGTSSTQTRQNLNNLYKKNATNPTRTPAGSRLNRPFAENLSKQPPNYTQYGGHQPPSTPKSPPPPPKNPPKASPTGGSYASNSSRQAPNSSTGSGAQATATRPSTSVPKPPSPPPTTPPPANNFKNTVRGVVPTLFNLGKGGMKIPGVGNVLRLAMELVKHDPFPPALADENAILKRLMPSEPPQELDPPVYQFNGGQGDAIPYRISGKFEETYIDTPNYQYDKHVHIRNFTLNETVWGAIGSVSIQVIDAPYNSNLSNVVLKAQSRGAHSFGNIFYPIKSPGIYTYGIGEFFKDMPRRFKLLEILISRLDGQPDTSGNPPPVVQPIHTTNITNVYNNYPPPEVNNQKTVTPPNITSNAPPIVISPIATAPAPQIIIPQLQPDIPVLISPRTAPSETDPDIAQPQQPSYPTVTQTPSAGVTAQQAEESKYNNTRITQSTGVSTPVQTPLPVPEIGQKPNVENEERTPTFSTTAQTQTPTNSESSTSELLEIEQALIRLRISISSLQPTNNANSLSNDIQQLERDLTSLRNRASTATPETTATELQRIRNRLRGTQQRITNLTPSAQADLANNQRQQIEQQIDREITRLRSPTQTPTQTPTQAPTQAPTQTPTQTETERLIEQLREQLTNVGLGVALLTPLVNPIQQTATNTAPEALKNAAASGVCSTLRPGGCMAGLANNAATAAQSSTANQNLLNRILGILDGVNQVLIPSIWQRVQTIDTKLGAQMPGGLGGAISRMSRSLGIDRVFNLINFMANLHNASMLSASLKVTLLEMLSSVGNATGLLQTSEGENVDLNSVFNQGIEKFITSLIGIDAWASMKTTWRKYSSIYRAATNSLNAISSMFNSIGDALETTAEHTGKIGNAIRAAGLVRENAYNFMAEKLNIKTSRFMTFQSKVGSVTQVLETVNEIAENIVEGQQQYTEAVKATQEFKEALANAPKSEGVNNKLIKEEAEKIKQNLVKDPTGEDEEGLLSFLTDL